MRVMMMTRKDAEKNRRLEYTGGLAWVDDETAWFPEPGLERTTR